MLNQLAQLLLTLPVAIVYPSPLEVQHHRVVVPDVCAVGVVREVCAEPTVAPDFVHVPPFSGVGVQEPCQQADQRW